MNCPACKAPNPGDARFCGNCGRQFEQAQTLPTDLSSLYTVESSSTVLPPKSPGGLASGEIFAGRYEIRALIDSSGSDHYRAHDRVSGTDVSLKLVRPELFMGGGGQSRFLREAAGARDIRHPNIAAVYDVGEDDGQAYFTSEALEGISLREWNRRRLNTGGELGMSAISAIIFAILDAVMTIHIRNLVRVDLKPANIMLLSDPAQPNVRLKLTDVGVPQLADAHETAATGFAATPYRAPEALTTAGSELQPSADIYSVSMIFYELLTGVALGGHWQAPSAGRSDVPPAIDALVQDGLSNNPRRRPKSVGDYRRALEEALGTVRADPKPAPAPRPMPGPGPGPGPGPKPAPAPKVDVKTWPVPDFLVPILKTLNMPFMMIVIMVQTIVSWIEVLMFSTRPLPFGKRKAARGWLAILVSVVLIGIVGLAGWGVYMLARPPAETVLANADDDLAGRDSGGDTTLEPAIDPAPTPARTREPEPPPSAFARFNGYWADDFGGAWTVQVNDRGETRGRATTGMFAGTELAGAFSGRQFEFMIGNAYGAGGGAGVFDGGCHIDYETLDPFGSGELINAKLHINHPAGAPCP